MPTLSKKHKEQNVALVDVVDRLLEKGAVVQGDVAIRLADIDLVYIGLRLMVTSISKVASLQGQKRDAQLEEALTPQDVIYLNKLEQAIKKAEAAIPKIIDPVRCLSGESNRRVGKRISNGVDGSDAEKIEQGITRLALTVVELLRRIMEREAVRQVKMNHLTTRETQKLGMALKALAKKMEEMRTIFGLEEEDLNLDLGPLGNLM